MRIFTKIGVAIMLGAFGLTMSACDWTSGGGGNSFNSSQGNSVNWTGVYKGTLSGRAVRNTTGAPITRLVMSQAGNAVEIVDNNGNVYTGTVGAPGSVSRPDDLGAFPPGALLVQSQITWKGKDAQAGKDIEFVGVLHLVTVTDVKGRSGSSDRGTVDNRDTVTVINQNTGQPQVVQLPGGGTFTEDGTTITETRTDTDSNLRSSTGSSTYSYTLTEQNSQYRLQGTWVEQGGAISEVDAISAGGIASLIATSASEDAGDQTQQ